MARDYQINGEVMVQVKGKAGSAIASLSNLGLTDRDGIVTITPNFIHEGIPVDAWGDASPEEQFFLAGIGVRMTLVHFDQDVIEECMKLSQAGAAAIGTLPRAGSRMGGGVARFAAGNNYIGLNLTSPVQSKPWRFYFTRLTNPPFTWPLGTRRSHVVLNWEVVPYTIDPWNAGAGALGTVYFDRVLDT